MYCVLAISSKLARVKSFELHFAIGCCFPVRTKDWVKGAAAIGANHIIHTYSLGIFKPFENGFRFATDNIDA